MKTSDGRVHPDHLKIEAALKKARGASGLVIEIDAERPANLGFLLYTVRIGMAEAMQRVEAKEVLAFLGGLTLLSLVQKGAFIDEEMITSLADHVCDLRRENDHSTSTRLAELWEVTKFLGLFDRVQRAVKQALTLLEGEQRDREGRAGL